MLRFRRVKEMGDGYARFGENTWRAPFFIQPLDQRRRMERHPWDAERAGWFDRNNAIPPTLHGGPAMKTYGRGHGPAEWQLKAVSRKIP